MNKISNRDRILSEGMRVVHQKGFGGASVRDIVAAAGVPQGSFTNHFASKEAFGLEILDLYYASAKANVTATLLNEALPPLERIRAWVGTLKGAVAQRDMKTGCMFGNFSAEATNCDGAIRLRLTEIFGELEASAATCLRAAIAARQLPADFNVAETAGVMISGIQGAILLSKALRNIRPLEQFEQVLFDKVLR